VSATERSEGAAISVRGASKRFRLYHDRPTSLKQSITRFNRQQHEEFWAVRDVDIEIPKGSTYGLIGHNGSGKSTLLRMIAGIYRPTTGEITTRGRISALLELGAGFHPELTGRENIFLNASILGLSRKEIRPKVDEIVEFAGLGEFIDSPVKVYSSGMYVRLGFAVAVHVDPEILIIDEVIAVGDEEFQRRCFDHLYELRRRGTTIVVVSHSHALIQQLCDEIAWLDHGVLQADGEPAEIILSYLKKVDLAEHDRLVRERTAGAQEDRSAPPGDDLGGPEDRPAGGRRHGTGEITICQVEVIGPEGSPTAHTLSPMTLRLHLTASKPIEDPVVGIAIHHDSGAHLAGWNTRLDGLALGTVSGDFTIDYVVPRLVLQPGTYRISVSAYDANIMHAFDVQDRAHVLRVQHGPHMQAHGLVDLSGTFSLLPGAS
jgi:ABC-type polysaccharide/polyol phosphate transport system ATPase subunit